MNRRTFIQTCGLAAGSALLPALGGANGKRKGKTMSGPNILWLMTDEQRTDSMGCYGSSWAQTPNLDRLADRGTRFKTAVVPSPVCIPSRTSVLTAKYPHTTGTWANAHNKRLEANLLEPFHAAGYRSASFGKQHYDLRGRVFQEEKGIGEKHQAVGCIGYRKPYHGDDYGQVQHPGPLPWILAGVYPEGPETRCEYQVVDGCIDWLKNNGADGPFFLRASFPGPHTPVVPPKPFDTLIDDADIDLPPPEECTPPNGCPEWLSKKLAATHGASVYTPDQIRRMRRHYYGNMAFLDQQFGRLLGWMEQQGLLENTVIAFSSDHGTCLADHGLVQKESLFESVVNVPFIVALPERMKAERGTEIGTPVSLMSLLPTLLEIAGGPIPDGGEAPSLARSVTEGAEPEARPILAEIEIGPALYLQRNNLPIPDIQRDRSFHVMVRDGQWKYIHTVAGGPPEPALFDLDADPGETRNVADVPANKAVVDRLATLATLPRASVPA